MECKRALVETGGDLDAAAELMRKQGLAKADKKAARVAAEGVIVVERSADGHAAAMVEINCETDFVAREQDFRNFAADLARLALRRPIRGPGCAAGGRAGCRRDRRCSAAAHWSPRSARTSACAAAWCSRANGVLGAYAAWHPHRRRWWRSRAARLRWRMIWPCMWRPAIRATSAIADVPAEVVAKEREILTEQAARRRARAPRSWRRWSRAGCASR